MARTVVVTLGVCVLIFMAMTTTTALPELASIIDELELSDFYVSDNEFIAEEVACYTIVDILGNDVQDATSTFGLRLKPNKNEGYTFEAGFKTGLKLVASKLGRERKLLFKELYGIGGFCKCHRFVRCRDPENLSCLRARTCKDLAGSKRCTKVKPCKPEDKKNRKLKNQVGCSLRTFFNHRTDVTHCRMS